MRILFCGDRNWTDEAKIRQVMIDLKPSLIIQGQAQGADLISKRVAISLNIPTLDFPAQWKLYGRAAGPIRNKQMLDEGKPDFVVAFHSRISESKGTKNMLDLAKQNGIPYLLIE